MNIQYTPQDLIKKISQNNFSYSHSYFKKITEVNTSIEKLQDKATAFRKNVKKLKRYSPGGISKDLLESQVEDFVKSYNTLKSNTGNVTDKDTQRQLSKLEDLFSDNEKNLRKIGIEKENGKYTFNQKTFAKAADQTINTLFFGHDSFIGKADKIMRRIEETSDEAHYSVAEHQLSKIHSYKDTDVALATYMTLAGQTTSTLKTYSDLVKPDIISNSDVQDFIKAQLKNFAKSVYQPDATVKNETLDKLNQLCLDNKEDLAKLGMTFDGESKKLSFDESIDMTSSDFQSAYDKLFGKDATFGTQVSEHCKNIFNDLIQPDKIGVTILDKQA